MVLADKSVLVVILVPRADLVYQPSKRYPARVGVGRVVSLPLVLVLALLVETLPPLGLKVTV